VTTTHTSISPLELAERIAAGESVTVLDVRGDADWRIEGPGVRHLHVPAAELLADPRAVASLVDGPVAVLCARGATAQAAAEALAAHGVDAAVVAGGMRGWIGALQERPVPLPIPRLEVVQVQRPGRGCLSYLLVAGGEALVVDPAPDAEAYAALASRLHAEVRQVIDTHLHADHLSGARALAELTGARLRMPAAALERGIAFGDRMEPLYDGERLKVGGVELRAVALPGHTTDMMGLLVAGRALVGGDSLFADGIARPDLQRGDPEGARAMSRTLHATLHGRVLSLPDEVVLLPGHAHPGVLPGPVAPTLGELRRRVPELAMDDADAFADSLLAEIPPRPANYEAVIAVNAGERPFDPELESGGNSCATR